VSTTTTNVANMVRERYLAPAEVCEMIPGMTTNNLAQLRFTGKGPKFLKPTPRTVVYREADVVAWLEASERTITGAA
jgi:hypothetical protein